MGYLICEHEEADDRIMYHINHAVTVQNYEKVIVASTDTDIFMFAISLYTLEFPQFAGNLDVMWTRIDLVTNENTTFVHPVGEVFEL